jgi:hypothetical protein
MEYSIDMSAVNDYAKRLERLHRSALPSVVRATLNNAVYDVKTNTMPKSAKKHFKERDKNFFKVNSRFDKATGWNISSMKAVVGFVPRGDTNKAVEDLEKQEHGGKITNKAFIAMKSARTGNSPLRKTRSNARISTLRDKAITKTNSSGGHSKKQQFIRAAFYSMQHGNGLVLGGKTSKGGRTLFKIHSISSTTKSKGARLKIKAQALYNVKKGRAVSITSPTHFMERATEKSALKMPLDFKREAERQFKKYLG